MLGTPPFSGDFWQLAYQHRDIPPSPLREKNSSLSPAVERVVLTALAKDPKQRFASVQTFATALEQASKSQEERQLPPRKSTPLAPAVPSAPLSSPGNTPTVAATAPLSGSLDTSAIAPSMPSLSVPLPKDAQFNLDTPPPPELFQHILREIGRRVRDGR